MKNMRTLLAIPVYIKSFVFKQTIHCLMEKLSKAHVNFSETTFDKKGDLEQLIHPYVSS